MSKRVACKQTKMAASKNTPQRDTARQSYLGSLSLHFARACCAKQRASCGEKMHAATLARDAFVRLDAMRALQRHNWQQNETNRSSTPQINALTQTTVNFAYATRQKPVSTTQRTAQTTTRAKKDSWRRQTSTNATKKRFNARKTNAFVCKIMQQTRIGQRKEWFDGLGG